MLVDPEFDELEEMDDGLILIGLTPQLLLLTVVVVWLKLDAAVVVVGLLPPLLAPLTPTELLPLLSEVRADSEGSKFRLVLEHLMEPWVVKGDVVWRTLFVEADERRRFSLFTLCILSFCTDDSI